MVGEFDRSGALTGLRGFLIDVTATVEAELALVERERQFRSGTDHRLFEERLFDRGRER